VTDRRESHKTTSTLQPLQRHVKVANFVFLGNIKMAILTAIQN